MNRLQYNYGLFGAASLAVRARQVEHGSREKLKKIQQKRFHRLISHSRKHSPFYRDLYKAQSDIVSLDGLTNLQPVSKGTAMERFDDIVTDRSLNQNIVFKFAEDESKIGSLLHDKYFVARTSGTTGMVGHYVHDLFSYFLINVLTGARSPGLGVFKFLKQCHYIPRRMKIVSILSPTANLGVSSVIASSPMFVRLLTQFKLVDIFERWDGIIDILNRFQPDIVGGFPTILDELADSQLSGRLRIEPKTIRSGGEMLTARLRMRIAEAFQCDVYDCYGCAESGWVGMECEQRQGIHLFADWFILEPVDESNQLVPRGVESSKILLTNLANYVQPFIRFELPDRITMLEDNCVCGSILPRISLKGRTSEVLYLKSESGKTTVPPFHLTTLAEMVPGIGRYQVIQEDEENLTVSFSARTGADAKSVRESLEISFRAYLKKNGLGPYIKLKVVHTDTIERDPSGKIKQVLSRIN